MKQWIINVCKSSFLSLINVIFSSLFFFPSLFLSPFLSFTLSTFFFRTLYGLTVKPMEGTRKQRVIYSIHPHPFSSSSSILSIFIHSLPLHPFSFSFLSLFLFLFPSFLSLQFSFSTFIWVTLIRLLLPKKIQNRHKGEEKRKEGKEREE